MLGQLPTTQTPPVLAPATSLLPQNEPNVKIGTNTVGWDKIKLRPGTGALLKEEHTAAQKSEEVQERFVLVTNSTVVLETNSHGEVYHLHPKLPPESTRRHRHQQSPHPCCRDQSR